MTPAEVAARIDEIAQGRRFAGIRISSLCLTRTDGCPNLVGRAVFAFAAPGPEWAHNLEIGPLSLYRYWLDAGVTRRFGEHLAQSRIGLGTRALELKRRDGTGYNWTHLDSRASVRNPVGWPADDFVGSGDSLRETAESDAVDSLDERIIGWSRGLFGTSAQLARFLGDPGHPVSIASRDASHFQVLIPTYARILRAHLTLSDQVLRVEVESHLPSPGAFTLFATHDALVAPLQFRSQDFKHVEDARWVLTTSLPAEDGPYELRLLVGDVSVHSSRVGIPRLASQIHALIDPDSQWLQRLLESPRKRKGSDAFEHYVVTLLNLCGIPAVHYGFQSPEGAPDIVAVLDEETVLVAECKVIPPTTQILEILHGRMAHIVQSIHEPNSLTPHVVYFHPARSEQVSLQARRFASEHGIRLVSLERLQLLHAFWERGEPRERLLAVLLDER